MTTENKIPDVIWAHTTVNGIGVSRTLLDAPKQKIPTKYLRADLAYGYFATTEPEDLPNKFVALFGDGSGSDMYKKQGGEFVHCHSGEPVSFDYFIDAQYSLWVRLPDDYQFWIERE